MNHTIVEIKSTLQTMISREATFDELYDRCREFIQDGASRLFLYEVVLGEFDKVSDEYLDTLFELGDCLVGTCPSRMKL